MTGLLNRRNAEWHLDNDSYDFHTPYFSDKGPTNKITLSSISHEWIIASEVFVAICHNGDKQKRPPVKAAFFVMIKIKMMF